MVTLVAAIILTRFMTVAAAGIFTIVPVTKYVYINDTVTFDCATNETGYTLVILARGIPPSLQTSVTLPNGGMMISFNVTATKESNGTDVTCKAFSNDGNAAETAYLYVQG
uniref:Immunoglobulin subtype domain-containing protein n=1 Tax=Amphimedon queenslandica TaxID=400682 RepID=A0A1X7SEV6_AMPQE